MELGKRIRLVFKDDDILSEAQKLEGFRRSWLLLEPHKHLTVSDVASHLLHAFQLHQSCPHGLLLSISGFVLPPSESTSILRDNETISVRRRKDVLLIEGNDVANEVQKLKAVEKEPVNAGFLLLANDEFEKEKGGYESDEQVREIIDDDEGLLGVAENSSGGDSKKKNRKRKATEKLRGYKEKKRRPEVTGTASKDFCKEKKDASIAEDDGKNRDDPADHRDKNNVPEPDMKRSVDVQEKDKGADEANISPKETKKVRSRNARRKTLKRRWLREMAKIQKLNATCESEGLRNWKEDQAKADEKKLDGQWKGQNKWKKYQADGGRNKDTAERNQEDGQPKGLLHWKLSSQDNCLVKGKKNKQHKQSGNFLKLSNRNGGVCKQQSQSVDEHEQLNLDGALDQHEQPGQNGAAAQEHTNQNCDTTKQSNHESEEEKEIFPIEIRPGHIRFKPLEEEEAVQQDHTPLETFNWNGITSKKKGQQWGKENHKFTPRNDYKTNKWNSETLAKENEKRPNDYETKKGDSETLTKEKEKQPNEIIDFDKLQPLLGEPKKGDVIAYQLLELSSTWTPEISTHRVGKVSWYNAESNQMMLLPVPEYPIISEKDDWEGAAEPDNSLYKEDGSLEIDFTSLINVCILTNGTSEGNGTAANVSKESGNVNALKMVLPGSSGKPTSEPSSDSLGPNQCKEMQPPTTENGGSVWDQLSEAINAKKEQLSKENGWGSTPKKVVVSHENSWGKNAKNNLPSPSPGSKWKNTQKPQPLQDNSRGKPSTGSKPWSYRTLRGSALGPTMAMLRSNKNT